jgi:aspartyl-tRNA(Asn)/glutamyl-tRNA(Gln) amidotransferase subunit B
MAVSEDVKKKYLPTIGIETHVQLKTKTKLFSAVGNDARQAKPNSLISHIDVGMPGALPVLNEAAIELACRAAFALNTTPQKFSKFDRKHYFYPDLPKGYQITQFEDPIIKGGYVEFEIEGVKKKIEITRVHLEEDAGKNTHPAGADYSLVDLNRAGTPLLEIVSEPQVHSAAEAKAYARELYLLMKYADVSDVDLYHGNMRFDINISISKDPSKLGKRAEIKNLNSFRSVESAVTYEIERQIELYEKGQQVIQETRGWDEAKQKTTAQRGKEEAHDYRYMPEPDVPPIELDDQFIDEVKSQMPKMPGDLRTELAESGLSTKQIETILDDYDLAQNYIKGLNEIKEPEVRKVWSQGITNNKKIRDAFATRMNDQIIQNSKYAALATVSNEINSNQFNQSLEEIILNNKTFEELKFKQVSDETEIEKIVTEVLSQNPQAAQDVKNGEMKAVGFLVGQVMAKSQGQANPQVAQQIIKKQLDQR